MTSNQNILSGPGVRAAVPGGPAGRVQLREELHAPRRRHLHRRRRKHRLRGHRQLRRARQVLVRVSDRLFRKLCFPKLMELTDLTGSSKKNPAKFSDTCSVRADGLCIGCLGQWAERGRENSNMQEFFRTTLYSVPGFRVK